MKKSWCEFDASTRTPPLRKNCACVANAQTSTSFAAIAGVAATSRPHSVGGVNVANGPSP